MELKPGSRWQSVVCSTEVIVVRPAAIAVTLECGGHVMVPLGEAKPDGLQLGAADAGGTLVGKRYVDSVSGAELLGSKAGQGALSVDGRALVLKAAKPLPASD